MWIIVNIYIPPQGYTNRKEALASLKGLVTHLLDRHLDSKILILGDWNGSVDTIQRWLNRSRLPLSLVPTTGSPFTYFRNGRGSALDHMVVSEEGRSSVSNVCVDRKYTLSDHLYIKLSIHASRVNSQEVVPIRRMNTKRISSVPSTDISNNNRWRLLDTSVDRDLEEVLDNFQTVSREVAEEVGAIQNENDDFEGPTYKLSSAAKRAIKRRQTLFQIWLNDEAPLCTGPKWNDYIVAKNRSKTLIRESSNVSWNKYVLKAAKHYDEGEMRDFWNWSKSLLGRRHCSISQLDGPIYPLSGENNLLYGQDARVEWTDNYTQLFEDVTGHSKDMQYWRDRFPGPDPQPLPGMDAEITWLELNEALRRQKSWKAPGLDGIPSEFYRTACVQQNQNMELNPDSNLGHILLSVANRLLLEGLPTSLNRCGLVTILKKGDPKNMDNYRGITLISTLVKLVTNVVNARITTGLEERNYLIREQAGFRSKEECVGHACALYEILHRRSLNKKRSYVAFVDFRKAYDTVPHEAMIRKLELAGVANRCLGFIRSQYNEVKLQIKSGRGYCAETIPVQRGVRQGCPLSPLEFDIFINDILDELRPLGVHVQAMVGRVPGLLFADDLVLIAPNRESLRKGLQILCNWSTLHEMSFGISKCAIMAFGVGAQERARRWSNMWKLEDKHVQVVDEYTYLGLPFSSTLDLSLMAKHRASQGEKSYFAMLPILRSNRIPLLVRVRILKSCLVPVLTYGGELWGMSNVRATYPQKILNQALKSLIGIPGRSSATSSLVLGTEFGIHTIETMVAAARTRAIMKYPNSRTIISSLTTNNPPLGSWMRVARQWLSRMDIFIDDLTPSTGHSLVLTSFGHRTIAKSELTGVQNYLDWNMSRTNSYLQIGIKYPSLARGITWLTKLRVGAFWPTSRLVAAGLIHVPHWSNHCPCCQANVSETLSHFIMTCTRWNEQRELYLGALIRYCRNFLLLEDPTNILTPEQQLQVVKLVCGGIQERAAHDEVPQQTLCIPNWLEIPNMIDELHYHEEAQGNDALLGLPGFIRVAKFLQSVIPIRQSIVARLILTPRANANNYGRAVLVEAETEVEASTDVRQAPL